MIVIPFPKGNITPNHQSVISNPVIHQIGTCQIVTSKTGTFLVRNIMPTRPRKRVGRLGATASIVMVNNTSLQTAKGSLVSHRAGVTRDCVLTAQGQKVKRRLSQEKWVPALRQQTSHVYLWQVVRENQMMLVTGKLEGSVIYPVVVVVVVDGIKCTTGHRHW